jgi:3-methyladenine DNA glycosylase AlkD
MKYIEDLLQANREEDYAAFQKKLLPGIAPETILGIRTPILRKIAKQFLKDTRCEQFLSELPHAYLEENLLHGFLISEIKDFALCLEKLEQFLPYIDNWAVCDQTSPIVFKKHKQELLPCIETWMHSDHEYTVRFGIGMLMKHFLDEDFRPEYLDTVCKIESDAYYINMEIAWFMATALAKQWDFAIACLEEKKMPRCAHNRTIQKAIESRRITQEQKQYLKTLKR